MNGRTQTKEEQVVVPGESANLSGVLAVPENARGVVLFAHGSGSGRFSPRNNAVARALQDAELATLLVDLLTEEEASDRRFVFNIELLAERLLQCTRWVREQVATNSLPIGYFGASTGAGAALVAAAQYGTDIQAVVSRGGRPDLAGEFLGSVRSPTLLIVGSLDEQVIELNRQAMKWMQSPVELVIVEGATHLFEEPGKLEEVARLARDWFLRYLNPYGDAG
jgi:putative phosphoribosyl transferase